MAIDPITAAGGAARSSTAAASMSQLGADYDSFLKLLTAQVANQDPLEPMDSTTFVSQLAQLSQVEQSIVGNANLEEISQRLASTGAMADVQLIGRDVSLATDRIELRDGAGRYSYDLAGDAATVKAVITTEDGTEIRTITGLPTDAETRHDIDWDGLDRDGLRVPDDVFRIEIVAEDADGEAVSHTGLATTRVEELGFDSGQPMLRLRNGESAYSAAVRTVY